jgi:methylmalonyl-CoA/ethylmalonyl-CoA epimerase
VVDESVKRLAHIAVVVRDVDAAVRKYADNWGIGPWNIYTINGSQRDMIVNDEPRECSFRMAFCNVGGTSWELVQPLDDLSTFAQHLREHGEGVHHIGFDTTDAQEFMDKAQELSPHHVRALGAGTWDGKQGWLRYTLMDTTSQFGVIVEDLTLSGPDFEPPEPDEIYPPQPTTTA